jgi:hypothetical protein
VTGPTPSGSPNLKCHFASGLGLQQLDHFTGLREAAELHFGEDQFLVIVDFEDATRFLDQFGIDTQFRLQFFRQTGGFGIVVSHPAIFDFDLHERGS